MLFIIILLFFFTNVYLWHDSATKDANQLYVKKMNAGMSINFDGNNNVTLTATSSEITLSRLWIDTGSVSGGSSHVYVELDGVKVEPGSIHAITVVFTGGNTLTDSNGNPFVNYDQTGNTILVPYSLPANPAFTIVNDLGVAVSSG